VDERGTEDVGEHVEGVTVGGGRGAPVRFDHLARVLDVLGQFGLRRPRRDGIAVVVAGSVVAARMCRQHAGLVLAAPGACGLIVSALAVPALILWGLAVSGPRSAGLGPRLPSSELRRDEVDDEDDEGCEDSDGDSGAELVHMRDFLGLGNDGRSFSLWTLGARGTFSH